MLRHVALLRGINVGKAKRLAMADLRAVFETLGYTAVRTHLQSGNVVFDAKKPLDAAAKPNWSRRSRIPPKCTVEFW